MFLVRLHVYIDLLKLKAYKLFKNTQNSDADLSWLLFLKKPTCLKNDWFAPPLMLRINIFLFFSFVDYRGVQRQPF